MKTLFAVFVAAVGVVILSGSDLHAEDDRLVLAFERSYTQEFPQLAMLDTTKNVATEPAEVVQGDLAKFVEDKVTGGEGTDAAELTNILSQSVSADAQRTFTAYVADPVPAAVKITNGGSLHWKGFSATIVFTADAQTFEDLKTGYNRIPFERLQPMTQEWFGEDLGRREGIQCYFRNDNLNKYYLFRDEASGEVFFKGIEG